MTYAARAEQYARAVVAGDALACKLVRLACQRHLDDLRASSRKAYPFRFDAARANLVCGFLELLPHVKGSWARRRERIKLEDWQCFVYGVPFGWVQRSDDLRRFRRVYVEVPRKNAKSTGTAGLGLYMLSRDGEHGAEVYSGAGSEKQAWEVFGPARLMAKNTPAFQAFHGVEVNAKSLTIPEMACKFEPIIGKPGDGASPSFSITDEYHEHDSDEQYATMVTGMGSREQPMAWVITTAGTDTAGPCYALRSELVEVLMGQTVNDQFFGVIYTIDDGMDWTSEDALRMANPNMGVSVFADYLRTQQRDAVNDPRKQSTFKTKHLNVWVTAASPYFNVELWNRLGDAPPLEEMKGEACWVGLDLASKRDVTANVKVFSRMVDGEQHFFAYGRFYLPQDRAGAPEFRHYAAWASLGHLVLTPGSITDYDAVEEDILADAERYPVAELGFDPYNAGQLVTHLQGAGITCVEVPQTVKHISEPMKWVDALIVAGRLHHDGNPAFAWMMSNVTAQIDRNENVYPRKEREEKKIDGAVALIIALGRAMVGESNVYTDSAVTLW